mgnify:CR=1 FL=1
MQVTGTLIPHSAMKDILTGIFFSMLIIIVMITMPLIGVFAWVILPLPVLYYRLKTGRHGSAMIVAISLAVLLGLTSNLVFSLFYFGSLLLTGFLLGESIERHLSIEKILGYTCLGLLALIGLFLMAWAVSRSQGIDQLTADYVSRYQALTSQLFSESARLYPDMSLDRQLFERASAVFMIAFPGIMAVTYLTMALINVIFIRKLLKKNGITVTSIENLSRWRASDKLVFVLIGFSLMLMLSSGALAILALNCLIILLVVYFFQGMAVSSFFFKRKNPEQSGFFS